MSVSWTEQDYPFNEPTSYIGPGDSQYQATVLTTTLPTTCLAPSGAPAAFLVGIVNNSLSAQPGTVLIYDSASGTSANPIASIGALGISQIITFPAPGLALAFGCVAVASITPLAQGIQVLVR